MDLPKDKKIVLFDGVCNMCDSAVQRIIKADPKDIFRFVALSSDKGQEILNHIGIAPGSIDSIILYQPGKAYYVKSQAALQIASQLKGLYPLLGILNILPKSFNDLIYDLIAKNRYKFFGKKSQCMIPDKNIKNKFL